MLCLLILEDYDFDISHFFLRFYLLISEVELQRREGETERKVSEEQQPGHEPAPIWDASATNGGLTYYTTMAA